MSPRKVIVSMPKMSQYLAVAPRPSSTCPSSVDMSADEFSDDDVDFELDELSPGKKPTRKRQRLDHLTPEEKLQRRKLKNRVAAQTARDRKKARMDDLEASVRSFEKEVRKLRTENELLWKLNANLKSENESLKAAVEARKAETGELAEVKPEKPFGPAAIINAPQQREQGTQDHAAKSPRSKLNLLLPFLLALLSAKLHPQTQMKIVSGSSSTKSLPSLRPLLHPTRWPQSRQERLARAVMSMAYKRKPPSENSSPPR